jgi:hypothetical protein
LEASYFCESLLGVRANPSVIATTSEGRLEHFFQAPTLNSLPLLDPTFQQWVFDRYVLTGPTLFMLAYAFGLWFRGQWPNPEALVPEPTVNPSELERYPQVEQNKTLTNEHEVAD